MRPGKSFSGQGPIQEDEAQALASSTRIAVIRFSTHTQTSQPPVDTLSPPAFLQQFRRETLLQKIKSRIKKITT